MLFRENAETFCAFRSAISCGLLMLTLGFSRISSSSFCVSVSSGRLGLIFKSLTSFSETVFRIGLTAVIKCAGGITFTSNLPLGFLFSA